MIPACFTSYTPRLPARAFQRSAVTLVALVAISALSYIAIKRGCPAHAVAAMDSAAVTLMVFALVSTRKKETPIKAAPYIDGVGTGAPYVPVGQDRFRRNGKLYRRCCGEMVPLDLFLNGNKAKYTLIDHLPYMELGADRFQRGEQTYTLSNDCLLEELGENLYAHKGQYYTYSESMGYQPIPEKPGEWNILRPYKVTVSLIPGSSETVVGVYNKKYKQWIYLPEDKLSEAQTVTLDQETHRLLTEFGWQRPPLGLP